MNYWIIFILYFQTSKYKNVLRLISIIFKRKLYVAQIIAVIRRGISFVLKINFNWRKSVKLSHHLCNHMVIWINRKCMKCYNNGTLVWQFVSYHNHVVTDIILYNYYQLYFKFLIVALFFMDVIHKILT